jgi:hypothetical protein
MQRGPKLPTRIIKRIDLPLVKISFLLFEVNFSINHGKHAKKFGNISQSLRRDFIKQPLFLKIPRTAPACPIIPAIRQ